jgi:hypothetical protein
VRLFYQKVIYNGAANFFGNYIAEFINVAVNYRVVPGLCFALGAACFFYGSATAYAFVYVHHVLGYVVANPVNQSVFHPRTSFNAIAGGPWAWAVFAVLNTKGANFLLQVGFAGFGPFGYFGVCLGEDVGHFDLGFMIDDL